MMDLFSIATDPKKELEGAEVKVDDETTLIIARFNNKEYAKAQEKFMRPYMNSKKKGKMSTKQADEILSRCMAKTILLGWTSLKIDGKEIPYSEENAYNILSDPRFANFRGLVLGHAREEEHYRLERLEEELGNYGRPSNTMPDGLESKGSSSKQSKKKVRGKRQQGTSQSSAHI